MFAKKEVIPCRLLQVCIELIDINCAYCTAVYLKQKMKNQQICSKEVT